MADQPQARALAERVFTDEDQRHFARLSGDSNPMHLDAAVARRLLTGRQVVHGVHLLLWALERWSPGREVQSAAVSS